MNASSRQDSDRVDQLRLQAWLSWQIMRTELHVSRQLIKLLAPFALRPVDFFILVLIGSNHGIHQRQVGDTLGISPPNLVSVMTRLLKKRLIRRTRGRQDRRIQHLYLTPAGSECLAQSEAVITRFEEDLATSISARKRAALGHALQQILAQ